MVVPSRSVKCGLPRQALCAFLAMTWEVAPCRSVENGLPRRKRLAMIGVFGGVWLRFFEAALPPIGMDCRGRLRALAMTAYG